MEFGQAIELLAPKILNVKVFKDEGLFHRQRGIAH